MHIYLIVVFVLILSHTASIEAAVITLIAQLKPLLQLVEIFNVGQLR
jgi:hypothetical protein